MDLRSFIKKINAKTPFSGSLKFREPMSRHTTFKTGGPADLLVRPAKTVFPVWAAALLEAAEQEGIPVFTMGKGANLLVSDKGIRGIVLDTGSWKGAEKEEKESGKWGMVNGTLSVKALSGTTVDRLCDWLARRNLAGLEFLAGMPGSIGGAVWMNARCYEKSVNDVLVETEILDESRRTLTVPYCPEDFSYKKSPFQNRKILILSARFSVRPGVQSTDISEIRKEMANHRRDRKEKGHYRFPCAGSAFKNNHSFGEPTGKIIDDLGLRGFSKGGATIAPWHGNLIINTGGAHSSDIRSLMEETAKKVREARGFELEPEIIFVGEW